MRRAELFPADHGLQARMAATAVLTPLIVALVTVGALVELPEKGKLGIVAALVLGIGAIVRDRRKAPTTDVLPRSAQPDLQDAVDRLALAADVRRPDLVLVHETTPNSWIVDLPRRAPRLHVTTGLLDLLVADELDAVLAHELSHLAHGDAKVMSVVGLPAAAFTRGSRHLAGPLGFGAVAALLLGAFASTGTNLLGRYRETAADAAAARLTGRPAALASALRRIAGELERIPTSDLREVGCEALNLLPVDTSGRVHRLPGVRRLAATHPPVEQRIAALERLERTLHGARKRPDLQ